MSEHPEELLSGFADGELGNEDLERVESHLRGCSECRELVAQIREMANIALPDELIDDLTKARFKMDLRGRLPARLGPKTIPLLQAVALGIAACLIVSLYIILDRPGGNNLWDDAISTETMGKNQAALSAGIY